MKLAIMQPYLFPYIGYFQLIREVDVFVLYDDVNFRKQSWINRNRILLNGQEHLFTIPCRSISSYKKINEVEIDTSKPSYRKFQKLLEQAYTKSSNYGSTNELIQECLKRNDEKIAQLAEHSIRTVCTHLNIDTTILNSSEHFSQHTDQERTERIINICKETGANQYINAAGGQELYSKQEFSNSNIELSYLIPNQDIVYKQANTDEFVPWLSIIDVLMHNPREKVIEFTGAYQLK